MTAHTQANAEAHFRQALVEESSLQVVDTTNVNHALLTKRASYRTTYLSGGGVAASSLGLPDLDISGLDDVSADVCRITDVCDVPLLVDVDTGFGASAFNVARTTKSLIKFGTAAMRTEDQVSAKRCGYQPNREIVSREKMVDRIKTAVDARTGANFIIVARTDALAIEGFDRALGRAAACVEADAGAIFPEAMTELSMYRKFVDKVKVPVLASVTESDQTLLFTRDELTSAGMSMVLYPLLTFRAMNKTTESIHATIHRDGTQQNIVNTMQTRMELYDSIGYHDYEAKLGALFA